MRQIVVLEPQYYPQEALAILQSFGNVVSRSTESNLKDLLSTGEILIVRLAHRLDRSFLDAAPRLQVIVSATTGLDHIDLEAANARNISVLSLRGETAFLRTVTATAEHTWGLLLSLVRRIPAAHSSVVEGKWDRALFMGRELQGRTLGIVGLGRIGKMVAQYGLAFRMQVIAYDPFQSEWVEGVTRMETLQALCNAAQVLSLHVPLNKETVGLMGPGEIAALPLHAVILNTSRGAILDETALLEGLEANRLGGAALDVIHDEYAPDNPERLRLVRYAATHHNLLLTPHLGGATFDSLEKVEIFMAKKLASHVREHDPKPVQ